MTGKKLSYKQIAEQIMKDHGGLLDGEAMPGERELAEKYCVNRSSVQYALRKLAEQGKVYRIKGKGTFIRKNKRTLMNINEAAMSDTRGITALVRSYGIKVRNVVLVCGTVTGNRFLESKLRLQENEPVYALHRVRCGNDEPLAVEYTYVPEKLFPDIGNVDFGIVSLYDYMDSKGHLPEKYDRKFRVMGLLPKEARYLELPAETPAFLFEVIGVDSERRPVEYTESYVRCDRAEFSFTTRI